MTELQSRSLLIRLQAVPMTNSISTDPTPLSPNNPKPNPFNPFSGGDSPFDPYIRTIPTVSEEDDNTDYLLGQATSHSSDRTYSYLNAGEDQQQPLGPSPTHTPPTSHSLHGNESMIPPSIDHLVAALLEQMQRMHTQQAELQDRNTKS